MSHFPKDLDLALQMEFSKVPTAMIAAASADLSSRYRSPDRDTLSRFILSDQHRLAYLATRLPATYAVVAHVLKECKLRMPEFNPKVVSDQGAGPGTATWAAIEAFPHITSCILHEKDIGWIPLGKRLMAHSTHEALKSALWVENDLTKDPHLSQDLTIFSYVLGELPIDAIAKIIDAAYQTSTVLVLIEPGTPHGFERIRTAREYLIQNGAHLVAPCPHHQKCPMAQGDWCHFVQRLERSSLHMSIKDVTMGYEDEKFSYLIASKSPTILPGGRILRHPQRHCGHVDFTLCTQEGLQQKIISKRHKDLYKQARKLEWGDVLD